jgi:FAD synthetase
MADKTHRPEQLSLSYNVWKDCIVLLVLILACWPAYGSSSTSILKTTNTTNPPLSSSEPQPSTSPSSPQPLQAVYVVSPHPFPEVEAFVATSATEYHLDLARYALPMRPALEAYLGEKPAVKAIFVGTRRTDPHGKFLKHFDPTDKDWPQFMRVHPVIDWHYAEIWAVSTFFLYLFRFVFGFWRRDEEAAG